MENERPQRHFHRSLPRAWVTLPEPVQRRARADPLLSGLFPSHVGYFPKARDHRVERDVGLDSTVFNYCVSGRGFCTLAGQRLTVKAGDLMVVPAGEAHAYGAEPSEPWTLHWFHAMGEQLPHWLERLRVTRETPIIHLGRSPELEALFVEVREALEEDYSEQQLLYAAQALAHLFGVMLRLRVRGQGDASALQRVLATITFMKKQLGTTRSVSELAALAHLSSSRYSELFQQCVGSSPKEYWMRLRIHRAAQLLDTTNMPVSAVAREVGFADPLHFSRAFRKVHELSPKQYRARADAAGASG